MINEHLNIPDEIWKPIPGFPGYEASTHGRIRSYRQKIYLGWRKGCQSIIANEPQKILQPAFINGDYSLVSLYRDKRRHTPRVNRLILLTFMGPCPPGMQCCHNDGNPKNNFLINLRWDTPKNNTKDKFEHGTILYGEENKGGGKLTSSQVSRIKQLLSHGYSCYRLGKLFSVSKTMIRCIKLQRNWKHIQIPP